MDPNEMIEAIKLGCRCMAAVLNTDDDDRPWFGQVARVSSPSDSRFVFSGQHDEAHVPGRHLLALLESESVGVDIAASAVEANTRALRYSLSRQVFLPQNRGVIGDPRPYRFLPHNIREALHGLYALYVHRSAERERSLAEIERMCDAIDDHWSAADGWRLSSLRRRQPDLELIEWKSPHITGLGRAIGPLTRILEALKAEGRDVPGISATLVRIVEHTVPFFPASGTASAALGTHTHSITSTLSGLARFARLTDDQDLARQVNAFFGLGLRNYADRLGWSIENSARPSDRGELNNTGDIIETALVLAETRRPERLRDVERIVRSHLLPAQLRDPTLMTSRDDGPDATRQVGRRLLGAFGFPAHYGHLPVETEELSFNTDIVGGVISSLVEVVRAVATPGQDSIRLDLLLDCDRPGLAVRVEHEREAAYLHVRSAGARTVSVAVPDWAGTPRIVGDENSTWHDGRLELLPVGAAGVDVVVRFPKQVRWEDLGHDLGPSLVQTSGPTIVAADAKGQPFAFFPPLERAAADVADGNAVDWALTATAATTATRGDSLTFAAVSGSTTVRLHDDVQLVGGRTALDFVTPGSFAVVEDPDAFDFGASPFTISLTVRPRSSTGRILGKGLGPHSPGFALTLSEEAGSVRFRFSVATDSDGERGVVEVQADQHIVLGDLHHLTITGGVRADDLALAIDETVYRMRPCDDDHAVRRASSQTPLLLGMRLGTDEPFVGEIGDLMITCQPFVGSRRTGTFR